MEQIVWQWCRFTDFSVAHWHHLICLRQAVFVVEQHCPYMEADELDAHSWHLVAWLPSTDDSIERCVEGRVAAGYLRVVDPGGKYIEPAIGRVLTRQEQRGKGLGKQLMAMGMRHSASAFPGCSVRISAQQHLRQFYGEFGFQQVGQVYDEDGIPHIEMLMAR